MIDLDMEWTASDDLFCEIGLMLCLRKITYTEWNTIVKAFQIHQYVLPDYRYLNPVLVDRMFRLSNNRANDLMALTLLVGHLEAHYTERHQHRLLSLLIHRRPTILGFPKTVV